MGEIARQYVDSMVDDLAGRVMAVRDAATVTNAYSLSCSVCGPYDERLRYGTAIHAVRNPGHIVTVVGITTTVYEDKGEPTGATGTQVKD